MVDTPSGHAMEYSRPHSPQTLVAGGLPSGSMHSTPSYAARRDDMKEDMKERVQ